MKNLSWKKLLPHVLAVLVFLVVALLYCKPVLQGKVVNQHDNLGWQGMAQQSFEFKEQYGHYPFWSNSMFSGMPAYQIAMDQRGSFNLNNIYLSNLFTFGLPKPVNFFFLCCLSFYILMNVFRVRSWIAVMSSLAYAYCTFNPVLVAVGHDTQMLAVGYAPLVIAGLLLIYQRKYWVGAALLATGFALQASTSHLQIVFYTLLICLIITVAFIIHSIKKAQVKQCLLAMILALGCGIVAFLSNAVNLLPTYEYAKYSIRGGQSELTKENPEIASKGGLDKDYAFRWSLGIPETFTLVVPGIYGGSNGGKEYEESKFAEKLTEVGYPQENAVAYANSISYWGDQPFTSGPVYLGAILCMLAILGIFVLKGWNKWWLIAVSVLSVLLAWGKNFELFNYLMFDYFPLYNKFRAPTMALMMIQFAFPVLAGLGLQKVLFGDEKKEELLKKIKNAGIAVGVVIVVLIGCYISFDYAGPSDKQMQEQFTNAMLQQAAASGQNGGAIQQQAQEFGKSFINAIHQDRQSLFGSDLLRSIILIVLAGGIIWLGVKQKIKSSYVVAAILILSAFDLLSVGRKYFNEDSFVDKETYKSEAFAPTPADLALRSDTGYYRVFNQTTDSYNESTTSYYNNSIGGYHPAKLQLYQDLIENQLAKGNMNVFNMLNTKYFIVPNQQTNQPEAQYNPFAYGPAWLVEGIKITRSADEEMAALEKTDLRDTVLIRDKFAAGVKKDFTKDSTDHIKLIYNHNDTILYESNTKNGGFAVFSEIYYPAGWEAFIDGESVPYFNVDYALRGMNIPAGKHEIKFIFSPQIYFLSNTITFWGSLVLYLLIAIVLVLFFTSKLKTDK